jgi:hypothetical protein
MFIFSSRMAEFSTKPRFFSNIVASSDSCSEDASKTDAIFASVCNSESVIDLDGIMDQVHHNEGSMRELLLDYRNEIDAQLLKISEILYNLQQDNADQGDFDRLARAAQCVKDASSDMLCSEIHAAAASMERHATKQNLKKCLADYEALNQAITSLSEVLESVEI